MRFVGLLVLAGCGRLEFVPTATMDGAGPGDGMVDSSGPDARPCVPVGHDEDGDGIDDACDLCPQLFDDGLDGDGDGIGDSCDISPLVQVRTMFDPFISVRSEWVNPIGTISGDALRVTSLGGGTGMNLALPPGRDTFEVMGNLLSVGAAPQVLLAMDANGPGAYYCEIYDDGVTVRLLFTETMDNSVFTTIDSALLPGRFDAGPFRLILDHTATTTTCFAEWGGASVTVSGANPQGIPADLPGLGMVLADVELTSFTRLNTP